MAERQYVLTLACPDSTGIVARISTFLADLGGWILEAGYHSETATGRFYTRQAVRASSLTIGIDELRERFGVIAGELAAERWALTDTAVPKRAVLLVSTEGHCLYELLSRWHAGMLGADVTTVIGNHPVLAPVAEMYGIPFVHVPVPAGDPAGKSAAFERIRELVDAQEPDAIVLARFMQVVPPKLCERWTGRLLNIHHGFLPSFKGARPYHQAYDRGVKMVGATCHYVTPDLDDGPIIEQDVVRIDHTSSAADLAMRGRDIEKAVLARGLQYHLQDRVLLDGHRTVVFA
ncbi:formyltetrahydrofolate deformylase [Nakamurella sp. YIM 132087]|uniref:Formyltetrahydrofolate deformylase n=1 Tax=Nakamurella alba TaxID=2665158 RepID=A0A7K1FPT3_9ACTN|nr:formyltetrahydrofolate deformylase [Nakamurella alba]MTD16147.1 formyltetrahydrofolate deformylase [Nakamurella alba]